MNHLSKVHPAPRVVAYVAGSLPSRSETFVYREFLALRERGRAVLPVSVHDPERGLGEASLQALGDEAVPVYGAGLRRMLIDALTELVRHPMRSAGTLALSLRDTAMARDLPPSRRIRILWQSVAALALAKRLRPASIGHLHAHMAHVPTTIAMYAAHELGIGFSFTGHANDLFANRTLLAEKINRARFVACISHWHRSFYRAIADIPNDRLPVVRAGVDVPRCQEPKRGERRSPRIVSVGRLVAKKGFDILLEAIADLRRNHPDIHVEIVGEGVERAVLEAHISRLNLARHVTLAGALHHAEVLKTVEDADVFVLPCQIDPLGDRDGIPVALMEAMARGVCVVSGDLPTIRELVRPNETGLLVPPGDSSALAGALGRLLLDRELRHRLRAAGRSWVEQEFSTPLNVARLISAFDAVFSALPE
ncbi:MAG TPA: glycosyltransferase family 4 protein [Myxococcota bacterium]|nr:glycosyltransferase family 4 protein [Myxococcota bacterium]